MGLFDQPLVCVDIETDGANYARGHILEIAAIRIEHGQIVDTFSTLLNPGISVPYFITKLTGITIEDLQPAPQFDDVAERLLEIMEGAIFVAHNVRFDYSFIKEEFRRIGLPFSPKMLCTVKLSRALYPLERSHKLSSLIERHSFSYGARHRAYDDAHVLWQFLELVTDRFSSPVIEQAVARQLALPSLPRHINESELRLLPTEPGIYIFEDEAHAPLYVGKSVNIKRRVMDHFTRDTKEYREFKMAQQVHFIRHQTTGGELAALLLESRLVKELQPLYNRRLRRQKQFVVAKATRNGDGYNALTFHALGEIGTNDFASVVGIYETRTKAKAAVLSAVRTFDLCPKLSGIEKANGSCFSYQLRKCHGACVAKEEPTHYNNRLKLAFERTAIELWPYDSAISISERQAHDEGLVVDNWRIIGQFDVRDEQLTVHKYEAIFDIDAYKILRAFLLNKNHALSIRPYLKVGV